GGDVLDIVEILQRVDQLDHLASAFEVHRHRHRRLKAGLRRFVVDARVLQRGAYPNEIARLTDDFEAVVEIVDFLCTGVEHRGQHIVLGEAVLRQRDETLAGEQIRHRTRVGHVAAVARHRDAYLARRAVAVVGQAFDQHRDTVGSVALVGDALVVGAACLLAGATLAGSLDVVVGDRVFLRLLNGVVQRRVAAGITATDARGHLDVLDQSSEGLAAAGVDHSPLVLGGGPLGMAAHAGTTSFTTSESDQRVYVEVYASPHSVGRGQRDDAIPDAGRPAEVAL